MARKSRASATPKKIDALKHKETRRKNIPTQENSSFMHPEDAAPVTLEYERRYSPASHPELYKRNEDLDPQLVWRGNTAGDGEVQLVWKGKDEEDAGPLKVDAVPIYIQEKVHPKAIINDIRRRQEGAEDWKYESDTPDLFADFNGIPDPEDRLVYYDHDQVGLKWSNRMILGDSLSVMASLAEKEGLRGKVQMIYLDPPYGIKFNSNWQVSTRDREVKDGKREFESREPEVVRAFRDTWAKGVSTYLSYLRDRLQIAHELLTDSGSIFVQISDENVHRVRAILDEVFGSGNFVSQIAFQTTSGAGSPAIGTNTLASTYDTLLWFAKNIRTIKYRQVYREKTLEDDVGQRFRRIEKADGSRRPMNASERADSSGLGTTRIYRHDNFTSQSGGPTTSFPITFEGRVFSPGRSYWKTNFLGSDRLKKAGRLGAPTANSLAYVRFLDDFSASPVANIWTDTRTGAFTDDKIFVVQTSTKVVARCLAMTTDPGDLVLDPTCGSGTTAYVAEQWGRRWITVDTSRVALTLARTRIMSARYPHYLLKDSPEGAGKEAELTGRPAGDGPYSGSLAHGFVYKRVPHVTLKSIANNAEIDVIWDKHKPALDEALVKLNKAAGQSWEDWQVPRPPVFPWGDKCQKLHARLLTLKEEHAELQEDEDANDEVVAKHGKKFTKPLKDLNTLLRRTYTLDSLPEHAGDPLPDNALPLHEAFWDAWRARQKEIDASIARNAETEFLYDQPYEDKGVVRVAGPFTMESLSPHRVLAANEDDPAILSALGVEVQGPEASARDSDDFIKVVLDNLETAGVGNTKKGERLRFIKGTMRPFSGCYVNAQARYRERETEDAPERRAAIFIGPEYGTVTRQMIVAAAKEAVDMFDVLIVCGFGFEAHASAETMNVGALTVLRVNMNQDLRMADRLKAADQGNLFVVFGEPDVDFRKLEDGKFEVEILGLDIFNPNTGEQRSSSKVEEDVACWFIDTDYDQHSFFVRHAYFLGGKNPYEKLQKTLKAEISEEAWETLHSAVSFPFPEPKHGRIAVKVINHYGDEVLKVFNVSEARSA